MDWKTSGTPHQIEVNWRLVTRALVIATHMNKFFIDKVRKIRETMSQSAENCTTWSQIMSNKQTNLALQQVTVKQVKKSQYKY